MKKVAVMIALVFAVGFTITSCKSEQKDTKEVEKEVVTEDVKEVAEEAEEAKEAEENMDLAVAIYQCPMNCEEGKTYDEPGQCPTCKMDLKEQTPNGESEEHDHDGESEENEG